MATPITRSPLTTAHWCSPREFIAYLHMLGEEIADPVEGFFGPRSTLWKVSREGILYLGGMRALLLQLAHPKVAQGVADHSRFRQDPIGRAYRTFQTVHTIVFGTREAAIRAAARTYAVHSRVEGQVDHPLPGVDDPVYHATDPHLLLWVYATLVDSTMLAYDTFLPPLGQAGWERCYEEGKLAARLFGVYDAVIPGHLADFRQYMEEMMAGDILMVTPTARELGRSLLRGVGPFMALQPLNYVLAAGMLPPRLRQAFGLKWTPAMRVVYMLGVQAVRRTIPRLPADLRAIPEARRAYRRCAWRESS